MNKSFGILNFLLILIIILSTAGCSAKENYDSEKLQIVCTVFPLYDWTSNLVGETANVSMLIDSGADMHSYQATADDIIKISECDILIYIGGESDKWIDEIIGQAPDRKQTVIKLTDKADKHIDDDEDAHFHSENDEHIWLSPKNAINCCKRIYDGLLLSNNADKDIYEKKYNIYIDKLRELDLQYETISKSDKTLIFADRFPFISMTNDYGIKYFSAFESCSAESESDFETVAFLSEKIDELNINYVLALEGSDKKIAKAVIAASKLKKCEILTLNSMQSVTLKEAENGADYIAVMQKNSEVLKTAMS